MIKAILWDFGGVLTTSPFEAFNRYEKEHNIPSNFIRSVNATNPKTNAWAKFENSQITIEAFDQAFAEESRSLGHPIPGKDVLALLSGDLRLKMVDALKKCKQHFVVGCITNNMKSGKEPVFSHGPDQANQYRKVMELFDEVIESSKEGVRKPEPEIYQIALKRLNVNPEECVFLDDLGVNLKPARALGMKTIKVIDTDQAINELSVHTKLSFD